MKRDKCQAWLAQTGRFTDQPDQDTPAVRSQGQDASATIATTEFPVDQQRRWPRCHAHDPIECNKGLLAFNALLGAPLSGFDCEPLWPRFAQALVQVESVQRSDHRGRIPPGMDLPSRDRLPPDVCGLPHSTNRSVEVEQTRRMASRKPERSLAQPRQPLRRGTTYRRSSSPRVPLLIVVEQRSLDAPAVLSHTSTGIYRLGSGLLLSIPTRATVREPAHPL